MYLQQINPQGFQKISQMMQNNVDPKGIIQQWYSKANDEQKQNLFKISKQWGCPDNVLSQIQNFK